jgi:hypothetical protein
VQGIGGKEVEISVAEAGVELHGHLRRAAISTARCTR